MNEENERKEIVQDEILKALGYRKDEKPFWQHGFVYTEKPKKDVRFLQYLFLSLAGAVLIFGAVMFFDTLATLFNLK